jgi:hypothetical protein
VEILLWLVPAALTTSAAMLVAGWLGRERTVTERQEEHAQERFARAIQTRLPTSSVSPARPVREPDDEQRIVVRPVGQPAPASASVHATDEEHREEHRDEHGEDSRRSA